MESFYIPLIFSAVFVFCGAMITSSGDDSFIYTLGFKLNRKKRDALSNQVFNVIEAARNNTIDFKKIDYGSISNFIDATEESLLNRPMDTTFYRSPVTEIFLTLNKFLKVEKQLYETPRPDSMKEIFKILSGIEIVNREKNDWEKKTGVVPQAIDKELNLGWRELEREAGQLLYRNGQALKQKVSQSLKEKRKTYAIEKGK